MDDFCAPLPHDLRLARFSCGRYGKLNFQDSSPWPRVTNNTGPSVLPLTGPISPSRSLNSLLQLRHKFEQMRQNPDLLRNKSGLLSPGVRKVTPKRGRILDKERRGSVHKVRNSGRALSSRFVGMIYGKFIFHKFFRGYTVAGGHPNPPEMMAPMTATQAAVSNLAADWKAISQKESPARRLSARVIIVKF